MADESVNPRTPREVRRVGGVPVTRLAVGGVALIYAIVFVVLNTAKVKIHFVFFTVTTHLWVGLLVCLIIGGLLGQAIGTYRKRMARSRDTSS
jgi:uncharacterized integral membrane protein